MTFDLDLYSKNILELLLQNDSPLSSIEIAEKMDISPRMVRYRLKPLGCYINQEGKTVQIKQNSGIYIEASSQWKKKMLEKVNRDFSPNCVHAPKDRREFLKFFLLICDAPITSKLMRYELGVSRVTILKDLDEIEPWFEGKNLKLIRKPGFGIELQGKDLDLRRAIIDYLINTLGTLSLAKLCRGSSVSQSIKPLKVLNPKTKDSICAYLSALDIPFAWGLTAKIENGLSVHLTDNSYIATVLYLAILIDQLRRIQLMNESAYVSESSQKDDSYYIAQTILGKIEFQYGLNISEEEKINLSRLISRLEVRKTISETIGELKDKELSPEAKRVAKIILREVSILLHPYLFVEHKLYSDIAFHLQNILDSMRVSTYLRKDIMNKIELRRPYIFSVAQKAVKIVESEIGLEMPNTEVGQFSIFLISAMERLCPPNRIIRNVFIVNDSGEEISELLRVQLISRIPEIEVIRCIGPLELLKIEMNDKEIDGIITTMELENTKIPSILVSPLLTDADINKVRDVLNIYSKNASETVNSIADLHLWNLIQPEAIELDAIAENWQEVIERSGLLLLRMGAIYPKYIEAMKSLIIENGPYVVSGPGIALLHARPDQGAKRTCMAFTRLKTPVHFGHPTNDPVDLVFALSAVDSFTSQTALKEYVDLLNNQDLLSGIRKARNREDAITILKKLADINLS